MSGPAPRLHHLIAKVVRAGGQALDSLGKKFEVNPWTDRLQPSTQVVKFKGHTPAINHAFIAPSATVVGKVTIGERASVGYGAVIRGDESYVQIGEQSHIGDRVMVHCSQHPKELPTIIGKLVTVKAGAILHGCTLDDFSSVGEGAQVMDGAKVGKCSVVAPGSLVGMGKTIPSYQLWAGVPARYVRDVTEEDTKKYAEAVEQTSSTMAEHALECARTWEEVEQARYDHYQKVGRAPYYYQRLNKEQMSKALGEIDYHEAPGRILNSPIAAEPVTEHRKD